MALTPQPGFSTLTLLPGWDISYTVEFKNKERSLGNNYLQITDGGNANPQEVVSLMRSASAMAIDSAVSDLRSYQGSTAFNWRLFPGGNYKLYFCTSFSEEMLSGAWERISAQLTRHPNPIYDAQPNPVVDGRPWGLLSQPIKWGNQQNNEANPLILSYNPGEVESRRAQSIFAAQNTIREWSVEFPSISSARLAAIESFLRQRRGRIPFQLNVGYGTPATLWICSKWSVRLMSRLSIAPDDMRYAMTLNLRQVYRAVGADAILPVTPSVSISPTAITIAEGQSTTYTLTLSSATSNTVTLLFAMSGTAINGTDYTVTASPVTIAPGNTTTSVTVTALSDAASEGSETAIISLTTPTNATLGAQTIATTTITNVAVVVPVVNIAPASTSIAEGSNTTYTVTMSAATTVAVTVPFTMSGTATNGTDYTVTASPLTIAAGQTTASITVTALSDANSESSETAIITLGAPTNATLGGSTTATTTIVDPAAEDPIVTNYANAVVAAGGTVAAGTRSALDVFVKGCKTDGIWTKLSTGLIMPFASNGWAGALVPLIAPAGATFTATLLTSADYSLATGIDPGATNLDPKRIATNINAQSIFTLASTQVSVYRPLVRNSRDCSVNTINGADVANRLQFHLPWENDEITFDAFDFTPGSGRTKLLQSNPTGLISGVRSGTNLILYRNGAALQTELGSNSSPVPNTTINLIGCFDSGFSFYSRSRTTHIYAGQALTASEELAHYNRVQAKETALGRQV